MACPDRRHGLPDPACWAASSCRSWKRATVDSRHLPAQHLAGAPGRRSRRQARAIMADLSRGRVDRHPARPARRRHRHRRLSTTANTSSRCGPRRTGPSWSPSDRLAALRSSAPSARGPRTRIVEAMNDELESKLPGIDWNFSQNIRDNVMEALSGRQGGQLGQDLRPRPRPAGELADQGQERSCKQVPGIENVGIFHTAGSRTWSSASIRQSASAGACRPPTSTTSSAAPWAPRPCRNDRGREALRHLRPLAEAAAQQRDVDPRHPGRHHQQHRWCP